MIAFVREVGSDLGLGEKPATQHPSLNPKTLKKQHGRLITFLKESGLTVELFPAFGRNETSLLVGDVALLLPETAVMGRPVDASRIGEVDSILGILGQHRPVQSIVDPGTLDAADVMQVGRTIYVTESPRTNPDGIAQLRDIIASHGYHLRVLPLTGTGSLRKACSFIAPHFLLVNPTLVEAAGFENLITLEIEKAEPHGAHTLTVGRTTVVAASSPKTEKKLNDAGVTTVRLDVSEFEKMDAGLRSLVLLLEPRPTNHSALDFRITPVLANGVPLVDRHASQATVHGGLVFTSQVLPFDPPTARTQRASVEDQTEQMIRNLAVVLSASGSSLEGVVRATLHVADPKYVPRVDAVWPRVFGTHRPARAIVANPALPPGVLVSIEAVAAQNNPSPLINRPSPVRAAGAG